MTTAAPQAYAVSGETSAEREPGMRCRVKNKASLELVLSDLSGRTRVEMDPSIKLSAKTVADLRSLVELPEAVVVTIPRVRYSGGAVVVSKPTGPTRTSPKQ